MAALRSDDAIRNASAYLAGTVRCSDIDISPPASETATNRAITSGVITRTGHLSIEYRGRVGGYLQLAPPLHPSCFFSDGFFSQMEQSYTSGSCHAKTTIDFFFPR